MNKYLYFLLFLTLLTSCKKKNTVDNSVNIIEINSKEIHEKANLSDIISGCEFIPLETSNNCLIGQIDKIEISSNNIFTVDARNARSILRFSLNGKFLNKISSTGGAPNEYTQVNDIAIDPNSGNIGILTDKNVLFFTPDNNYLRKLEMPIYGYKIGWYENRIIIYTANEYDLYEVNSKTGKESKLYFKTDENKQKVLNHPFQLFGKEQVLYTSNFDYTIYSIDKNGIKPHTQFVFNEGMFTDKDIPSLKEDRKNANNFVRIKYYFENKTHIQIIYLYKSNPYLTIHNKLKKKTNTYNVLGIKDDITYSNSIPVALGVDDKNNFISTLNYSDVQDTLLFKKKALKSSENMNSMSNPIILRFKYK